ncbi:SDR family NAD(P)-dependent oxidoreductase [Microbacterium sp. 20-116]|uniref:SDR family NAD(P)-dependent oxidoreductase n=1 Tax=Microbacterium sp. 20-116 TaxID=3239883 RepID=UPI0034E238BD
MTTSRIALITGGTAGIGLGLARRYAGAGARVVVAARPSARLADVPQVIPGATSIAVDLEAPEGRDALADAIVERYGRLDVLVNNAGIQRRVSVAEDASPWPERQRELDLLFAAPVHLTTLLLPVLRAAPAGQVVNVTSGGAFTPQPFAPVYSAMKAALHGWTVTLRHALADTPVAVTELIPPAVATGLAGPGQAHGLGVDDFCDAVFPGLEAREVEVGAGPTATEEFRRLLADGARRFAASATRFPVARFSGAGS